MSSKSAYSKPQLLTLPAETAAFGTDSTLPPKTPVKKAKGEHQHSLLVTLSPLPFPPNPEVRRNEADFIFGSEMRYVETPVPVQKNKLPLYEENDPMEYAIQNRIIFESSDQDAQNNSSQLDSSDQMDEENSSSQHPRSSQQSSQQNSENQRSPGQEEHFEGNAEGKARRNSKGRNTSAVKQGGDKKVVCNCKKTKCLKLYCDCFRLNQTCDGCNCVGCHNLDIYYEERNNAIMALMDRNPDPFGQKIEDDKHVKGCNCKKSNCLKKYCECYQAGLKCGQNCKCEQCKNVAIEKEGNEPEKGVGRNTAKKERRMVEI